MNYDPNFYRHKVIKEVRWSQQAPRPCGETAAALDEPIGLMELPQVIEPSKRQSAPGHDNISYDIVRHLPPAAQLYTLNLFNQLWSEGKLVDDWKFLSSPSRSLVR